MTSLMINNLKATTITLGTFRKKTVIVTTTKAGVQREEPKMGLDNQRIRFNWGYHDGASKESRNPSTDHSALIMHHFDRAYADGYLAGVLAQIRGEYADSSTAAWTASGRADDFNGWRQ